MMNCANCRQLEKELACALMERDQARQQAATATDLMMKGEALRDKQMLGAILGGAYDTDAKKARMVHILTGKKVD